jgi:hypothetical protein
MKKQKRRKIVGLYGLHWPRNRTNLRQLKALLGKRTGLYVLANGSMPLYIGKGIVALRIENHARPGKSKSAYWNYFSWFEVLKPADEGELECLLLQTLPFYVRSLNKQTGSLGKDNRNWPEEIQPIAVNFPKLLPKKKRRKKKKGRRTN